MGTVQAEAYRTVVDNWARGVRDLIALRPGQKLRHRDGSIAHVRAVLAEDEVAVIRRYLPRRRMWNYQIITPADMIVGLYATVPR